MRTLLNLNLSLGKSTWLCRKRLAVFTEVEVFVEVSNPDLPTLLNWPVTSFSFFFFSFFFFHRIFFGHSSFHIRDSITLSCHVGKKNHRSVTSAVLSHFWDLTDIIDKYFKANSMGMLFKDWGGFLWTPLYIYSKKWMFLTNYSGLNYNNVYIF